MATNQHLSAVRGTVHGRVQGVGFRYRTMWAADEQGVTGWVRNQDDGTVTFHAEGPPHRLDKFLATLRHGFPGVRVTRLNVVRANPEGYRDFRVYY